MLLCLPAAAGRRQQGMEGGLDTYWDVRRLRLKLMPFTMCYMYMVL